MSDTDPFTKIINQVLAALVGKLNPEIGPAISGAGYDPYKDVASGSASIEVAKASYSVSNLTGLSSFQLQDLVASDIQSSGSSLSGELTFHGNMSDPLNVNVSGELKVGVSIFSKTVGLSGHARITKPNISGSAQVTADTSGGQLCVTKISGIDCHFNYDDASIWINDLGFLNYLLKPVESLILDATKGAIRNLISSKINGVIQSELNKNLPQCTSL